MSLNANSVLFVGFLLALVRSLAWVFTVTPFAMRAIPVQVKLGLSVALSLAEASHLSSASIPFDLPGLMMASIIQAFIGFALGLIVVVLFNSIRAAGGIIDDFAGFNIAAMFDPMSDSTAAPFGRFYELCAVTLLFTTNLHLMLVKGFLRSFDAINGVHLHEVVSLLTHNLDTFMVSALEIAGPVLAVLFLTEVTLGLLARTAPAMNVFALGFSVRIAVAFAMVAGAIVLVVPAASSLIATAVRETLSL
jgi:flagellar biosynthetic protein FliR